MDGNSPTMRSGSSGGRRSRLCRPCRDSRFSQRPGTILAASCSRTPGLVVCRKMPRRTYVDRSTLNYIVTRDTVRFQIPGIPMRTLRRSSFFRQASGGRNDEATSSTHGFKIDDPDGREGIGSPAPFPIQLSVLIN